MALSSEFKAFLPHYKRMVDELAICSENIREILVNTSDNLKRSGEDVGIHLSSVSLPRGKKQRLASKGKGQGTLNAFQIFCRENRKKIKEQHPEATFAEIQKAMGETWHSQTPEEKEKYSAMAKETRDKFLNESTKTSDSTLTTDTSLTNVPIKTTDSSKTIVPTLEKPEITKLTIEQEKSPNNPTENVPKSVEKVEKKTFKQKVYDSGTDTD